MTNLNVFVAESVVSKEFGNVEKTAGDAALEKVAASESLQLEKETQLIPSMPAAGEPLVEGAAGAILQQSEENYFAYLKEKGAAAIALIPNMRKLNAKMRQELFALKTCYEERFQGLKQDKRIQCNEAFYKFTEEELGLSKHQVDRMIRNAEFESFLSTGLNDDQQKSFNEHQVLMNNCALDEVNKIWKCNQDRVFLNESQQIVIRTNDEDVLASDMTVARLREILRGLQGKESVKNNLTEDVWESGEYRRCAFSVVEGTLKTDGDQEVRRVVHAVNVKKYGDRCKGEISFSVKNRDLDAYVVLRSDTEIEMRWFSAKDQKWFKAFMPGTIEEVGSVSDGGTDH